MKIYQWHKGNSTGRRLFDELLAKVANEEWDDEYLLLLIEYQKLYPASEKFEVFYAKYALAHGNTQLALAIARDGERKRRVSPVVWELLAECYERLEMFYEAALYRAYLRVHCRCPYRRERSNGILIYSHVPLDWGVMHHMFRGQTLRRAVSNGSPAYMRANGSRMSCRNRIRIGWEPTSSAGS